MSKYPNGKNCDFCDKIFYIGIGGCCSRQCHNLKINSNRDYDDESFILNLKNAKEINDTKRYGKKVIKQFQCKNCHENFEIEIRELKFEKTDRTYCSKDCLLESNEKPEIRQKATKTFKQTISDDENFGFRNQKHREKAANKNKRSSSKHEREFRKLLKEIDPNWKAHRTIATKAVDLINHDLKIIFEYDGPSHFRPIYGDDKLQTQKKKDQMVEEWCLKNSYKLYRLSECCFLKTYEKNFSNIITLLYQFINSSDKIKKMYNSMEYTY